MSERTPAPAQSLDERDESQRKYFEMLTQTESYIPDPSAIAKSDPRFRDEGSLSAFDAKLGHPENGRIVGNGQTLTELKQEFGPDYIIRPARTLRDNYKVQPHTFYETDLDEIDHFAAKYLLALQKAGVHIPPTYFIAGIDDSGIYDSLNNREPIIFQATVKVEGKHLVFGGGKHLNREFESELNEEILARLANELTELLQSLMLYLKNIVKDALVHKYAIEIYNEKFLFDVFRLEQYVFGHLKQSSSDEKVYLVDTEVLVKDVSAVSINIALYSLENSSKIIKDFLNNPDLLEEELNELFTMYYELRTIVAIEESFEISKFYSAQEVVSLVRSNEELTSFTQSSVWHNFEENAPHDGSIYKRSDILVMLKSTKAE